MRSSELTDAVNASLSHQGVAFVFGAETIHIPDVVTSINGSIEGHPVRFDFHGPSNVEEREYLVWVFDPRTTNQIGEGSAPSGFPTALSSLDWTNLLGALTH